MKLEFSWSKNDYFVHIFYLMTVVSMMEKALPKNFAGTLLPYLYFYLKFLSLIRHTAPSMK